MTLLDRYIFKSVLLTFAAAIGLFAFVLMLGNTIRDLLGPLLTGQLGWGLVPELLFLLLLAVAPFALPLGMLTGVLLTLGRLSADSEITAMRAAGLSLPRIARPILLLGLISAAGAIYANFQAMPHGRVTYEVKLTEAIRANPLRSIVPKTFIRDFRGKVFYIGDKQGSMLHDIWFWRLDDEGQVTEFIRAESGQVEYDDATNDLILTLTRGQIEQRNPKNPANFSESPRTLSFANSEPQRLPLDRVFGRAYVRQKKLPWMTYSELRAEQARLAAKTAAPGEEEQLERDRMKVSLVIAEKFNTALAVLSFALIGVPLGIKVSRRETSANLGVAVMLALGYYFLTVMVGWIDRHPEYRPDLLLWIPNLVFLALGLWLFRRAERT